MELEVIYQHVGTTPWGPAWSPHYVFDKAFHLLQQKYLDVKFTHINPTEFTVSTGFPSPAALAIINPKNKKRIILSYTDSSRFILYRDEHYGWLPETIQQLFCLSDIVPMRQAFSAHKENKHEQFFCQISSNDEINLDIDFDKIVKPFNQVVYYSHFDLFGSEEIIINKQSAKNREQKLLFRGMLHGSRIGMSAQINHEEIVITEQRLHAEEYSKELITNRCGLSLNGVAEISNRDLEFMAVGIPIIRPLFKNIEFHEPLIPNVHYIPYDYERNVMCGETMVDDPLNFDYSLQTTALIEKWEEVKNDYDFLEFVGNNAREWYLKNAKLDVQAQLFVDMLDIKTLE